MHYTLKIFFTMGLFLTALCTKAQEKGSMVAYPDQQVYITGERIWLAGKITGNDAVSSPVQVLLADRTGKVLEHLQLLSKDNLFQGNMLLNGEMISDYYVLAFAYRGRIQFLIPVMIINPVRPPLTDGKQQVVSQTIETMFPIALTVAKNEYEKRELVEVAIDNRPGDGQYFLSVSRKDGLSDYADSILKGWGGKSVAVQLSADNAEGHLLRVKTAPGARIFASVLGDQSSLATVMAGDDGRANILLPYLYANLPLVLSALTPDGVSHRVNYEADFLQLQMVPELPGLVLEERFSKDLAGRIVNAEVTNKYRPEEKIEYAITGLDTTDFYGEPDKRYILDNYTRFPDMQEILQEYVPEVRVRQVNGRPILQVLNAPFKIFFEQPSLVLLDGVPVTDIAQLLALDPLKLKSIDVITGRFIMGDYQITGIVHYKSYRSDLAGYVLPSDQAVYDFRGIQIPVSPLFGSPGQTVDSRLPDMKNLIYWKPFHALKEGSLKFMAPDAEGQYRIRVMGVDGKGTKYAGEREISVK